ncbi:MAG: S-layer homology domain-containing protein [Clostridia bacterium]|nr:S-layer homology domain-containing protein [Clostridia bacterium]
MKKIFICLLVLICILSYTASAQINVTVTDSANNKVCISGDAQKGEEVTLVVLGDGMTETDLKGGVQGALVYARSAVATSDGYAFDFTMNTPLGGDGFTAIVSKGGQKESKVFTFYSDTQKRTFISGLNSGDITADDVETALSMFNMKDDELTLGADYGKISNILQEIRDEDDFTQDTNEFSKKLKQAAVINALNNGDETIFSENSEFLFEEEFNFSDLDEYDDYSFINESGKENIKNSLLSKGIKSTGELTEIFKNSIYLEVLTNYHMDGSAHVKTYFDKYKSAYEDAGFNLNLLKSVKTQDKNKLYSEVASSSEKTLSSLAQSFNKKAKSFSETSPSGGGGGGGGGGGSSNTVMTDSTDTEMNVSVKDSPSSSDSGENSGLVYTDVSSDFWAFEYINTLSEKGIINGKGNEIFSPFDMVKRSEFVKMIVLALSIEPDSSLCTFSDMTNSWAKPYVGVAVKAGFVSGISETEFAPDLEINREQACTMVARALGLKAPEVPNIFTDDKDISDYAKDYVYALRAKGIIDGRATDAGFAPKDGLSRAEAAKIIYLMIQ